MTALPNFEKDMQGRCYGGAYWNDADYRVSIADVSGGKGEEFRLAVLDSVGTEVGVEEFSGDIATQIRDLAHTSEEQDEIGNLNITREIHWYVGDGHTNVVDLGMGELEEIAAWLDFAFGDEKYEGSEDGWEW